SVTPQLAAKAVTLRRQWAPHRPVWIATSTHDGEESIVIAAHHVIANVATAIPHQGRAFERFTPNGPLAMLPMSHDRCSLVWCHP
ncbi:hypothetical protein MJM83_30285, partial [Salmonella enterica subsp. enterica serovar Montevideo]|nr:hypothetical protein [Salmonella enterica subsp. enterica serovar Montevideo]